MHTCWHPCPAAVLHLVNWPHHRYHQHGHDDQHAGAAASWVTGIVSPKRNRMTNLIDWCKVAHHVHFPPTLMRRPDMGTTTSFPTYCLYLSSLGLTATAVSPRMVSGRVVATGR
jgi:hypothetical protein